MRNFILFTSLAALVWQLTSMDFGKTQRQKLRPKQRHRHARTLQDRHYEFQQMEQLPPRNDYLDG